MRELPEAEVLRRDLERELVGKKIKDADAKSMAMLDAYRTRKQFTDQVVGRKVKAVERRGPIIVLNLEGTDGVVIDLGATGSIHRAKSARSNPPDGTELTLTFSVGGPVHISDREGGTSVRFVALDELDEELGLSGTTVIDPLASPMSWQAFGILLQRHEGKLRSVLLDHSFIAGIGPVYADEVLFEAGLRYDREVQELSTQEIRRLFRGLVQVLQDAVKYGGVSFPDDPFEDLFGKPGEYQDHLQVWGRDGEPCPRCRKPIEKARHGRGYAYFSPSQV